jgi:hypothetical protein
MSGFATSHGKGPGDVIRKLAPSVVVQPWTEDPRAGLSARAPSGGQNLRLVESLRAQRVAVDNILTESSSLLHGAKPRERALALAVAAEGMEGIANPSAVKNLQTMCPPGRHKYVAHGSASGLSSLFPGVKTTVLGPPTLVQSQKITKEASSDAEFWMLKARDRDFWQSQARNGRYLAAAGQPPGSRRRRKSAKGRSTLFPSATVLRGELPFYARWFVPRVRMARAQELLGIVRILDKEMNNTSVILLFEVGPFKLLFSGDAQIENWDFTLSKARLMKKLADVRFYKVGHHGSRNATPITLWNAFKHRSKKASPTRLQTVVSTMAGKFGRASSQTEVPRKTLITALQRETNFFTTQSLTRQGAKLKKTFDVKF